MMFQVSQSELNVFRTCRQKWWLMYIEGLKSIGSGDALRAGSLFHEAVARLYMAMRDGASMSIALELASMCLRAKTLDSDDFDQTANMDVPDMIVQVEGMLTRYALQHYDNDAAKYEVLYVEQPFQLPINWQDNGKRGHIPGARYIGASDVVLRDRSTNEVVVMEHKTTGSDATTFDARFEVDPQTPGYVWAAQRLLGSGGRDELAAKVSGRVLLNAIRRKPPSTPKVNKGGSVSSAVIDTTWDMYNDALQSQVNERSIPISVKQTERLQTLPKNTDKWNCRHEYKYSEADINRWFHELRSDVALLRGARLGNIAATRNGSACYLPSQPRCDMRDVCVNDAPEVRQNLYQIRDVSFEGRMTAIFERQP